jgi:hypothetical protein
VLNSNFANLTGAVSGVDATALRSAESAKRSSGSQAPPPRFQLLSGIVLTSGDGVLNRSGETAISVISVI